MSRRMEQKRNSGFTMVEVLATVAILVILLSVSFVGVAYYRDYLKITELDNAARDIYMAAQNRAVLLKNGEQMETPLAAGGAVTLAAGGGSEPALCYVNKAQAVSLGLLTTGAVDPALTEAGRGDFYIVYNKANASVTDVFYCEKGSLPDIAGAFTLAAGGRDARMKHDPMVGHYGGKGEGVKDDSPLPTPEVMVVIHNEELLTVDVTFSIPEANWSDLGTNWNTILDKAQKTVKVEYPGSYVPDKSVPLLTGNTLNKPYSTLTSSAYSLTYRWVLDALDTKTGLQNHHFRQLNTDNPLWSASPFGGDFTVTAEITLSTDDGRKSSTASGSDTDNSLFAYGSGNGTALLENVRHLQNLNSGVPTNTGSGNFSKAAGYTAAVQIADIQCHTAAAYKNYAFVPIYNKDIVSYNGGRNAAGERNVIADLHVTSESAEESDGNGAGLFSTLQSTGEFSFKDVCMTDPEIHVEDFNHPAGALLGVAADQPVKFENVDVLRASVIGGGYAGGVVGQSSQHLTAGNIRVESSSVSGRTYVGGVVGDSAGTTTGVSESSAETVDGAAEKKNYVHVVNCSVKSDESAGGVAGRLTGAAALSRCRVYWEPEEGQATLRSLLMEDGEYLYQIIGENAGGLAGKYENGSGMTITDSLAASMVSGSAYAGGLIGLSSSYNTPTTPSISISGSYADCYITGKGSAAGLVGSKADSVVIETCYAAGFIDMEHADKAAGLCLGGGESTISNTYSVMSYPGRTSQSVYGLDEGQAAAAVTNSYFVRGVAEDFGSLDHSYDYGHMISEEFFDKMTGFSAKRLADSHPYSLQKDLFQYEFPGLPELPHYGDWNAEFSKPSLVYYEEYQTGGVGFSGGNARYLTEADSKIGALKNQTIRSDGYAVAILKDDLNAAFAATGGFKENFSTFPVTYTYLDTMGTTQKAEETVTYGRGKTPWIAATWEERDYYLLPLPEGLVTGEQTSKDFFQYLRFDIGLSADGLKSSGESFYNPHFAETVIPYTPEDGNPFLANLDDPAAALAKVEGHASSELIGRRTHGAVSIRSPRHLYDLGRYADYYHNEKHHYSFQQELDLDYSTYTGHDFQTKLMDGGNGVKAQLPIGRQSEGFRGSYNGGCHTIENIAFQLPADNRIRFCLGLFGYSDGALTNIVYKMAPEKPLPIAGVNGQFTYVGALVGFNGGSGTIANCAVEGVCLDVKTNDSKVYAGGLVGFNQGSIRNSAAELASMSISTSNSGSAHVGGLVGENESAKGIQSCYAVGRLTAEAEEIGTQENPIVASISGFACRNTGSISNSYCAMDLQVSGAGAASYSFCDSQYIGQQQGTFHLNQGYFTYGYGTDEVSFPVNYDPVGGSALPKTYLELTKESIAGMGKVRGSGDVFPYPTGVKDAKRNPVHYGKWPEPMNLGKMGVYYWELLREDGKERPSVSLLAVDPSTTPKTIIRQYTLSKSHDRSGEVVRFGYGFYHQTGLEVAISSSNLNFSTDSGAGKSFADWYNTAEAKAYEANPESKDKKANDALTDVINSMFTDSFTLHSFHSFGLETTEGGLYPTTPNSSSLNAELTLSATVPTSVSVTFLLNPHFASALAVKALPNNTWTMEDKSGLTWTLADAKTDPSQAPGETKNPYEVRSIDQLQLIDWNKQGRNVDEIIILHNGGTQNSVVSFPYLSSKDNPKTHYWNQTYDLRGREGKVYSPIAEFYDNDSKKGNLATLDGWFGGEYDGNGYVIENVDIKGGLASCAGLFGVVYNGVLKNILLYSSTGNNTVQRGAEETVAEATASQWYAIGALAGVAAARGEGVVNTVQNCAVSGYRIEAKVYTVTGGTGELWGGVGVGGLLGLSNMDLTGCSAVADIKLLNGTKANDNLRVGGLVGSSQGTIENCYAGGSIAFESPSTISMGVKGIYIGGLVGGSYMKPLQAGTGGPIIGYRNDSEGLTDNALKNCYSYTRLPPLDAHSNIRALYAVGGTGEINPDTYKGDAANHGSTTYENCYFLESEVLAEFKSTDTESRTEVYLDEIWADRGTTADGKKSWEPKTDVATDKTGSKTIYFTKADNRDNRKDRDQSKECQVDGTTYYHFADSLNAGTPLFTRTSSGNWYYYTFVGWYDQNGGFRDWNGPGAGSVTIPGGYVYNENVTGLSYDQLAGRVEIKDGKNIYGLLPSYDPVTKKGFAEVTPEEDGVPVPGKYSYPPLKTSPELKGLDYPFPTVLTKVKDGETYHVHYGRWPLDSFSRKDEENNFLGGTPIVIDLFVTDTHTEKLVLTNPNEAVNISDWKLEFKGDTTIASAALAKIEGENGQFRLTVTGLKEGTVPLEISYGGKKPLTISVHVNADLSLLPSKVFLFPSDEVTVKMAPCDTKGNLIENPESTLKLTGITSSLDALNVKVEGADSTELHFTTANAPTELAMVSAGYTYTTTRIDDKGDQEAWERVGTSPVQVRVIQPWTVGDMTPSEDGRFTQTITFQDYEDREGYVDGIPLLDRLHFTLQSAGCLNAGELGAKAPSVAVDAEAGVITLTYPSALGPEDRDAELSVELIMTSEKGKFEAQTHNLTLTAPSGAPETAKASGTLAAYEPVDETVTSEEPNASEETEMVREAKTIEKTETVEAPEPLEDPEPQALPEAPASEEAELGSET